MRIIDPIIFSTNSCSTCALEINNILKKINFKSDQPLIFISGPVTSEDYVKLNKIVLMTKPYPKLVGIGHCTIGTGVWPFFNNSFLNNLPERLNLQNLVSGCPPHPNQIEKMIKDVVKT